MPDRIVVDAVIVAYNSRATLRACVEPLTRARGVAVTVVDNDSTDDCLSTIADLAVRPIASGHNGGFSFGCNLGAAAGAAPYLLFLNPDARIEPEALDELRRVLDREPEVGLAGPRILDGAGLLAPTQRRFPRLRSTWGQALFLHRLLPRAGWTDEIVRDESAYEREASPDWLSGACMLVRRDAFERIGGFDERFFLYCEDADLCRRLRSAGLDVRYEPAALVRHVGGASAPRATTRATAARSRIAYSRKHHGRVTAMLERAGVAVGEASHALASLHRPPKARGHLAALRAALAPRRLGAQA